ncbi:CPBP family intramembrane glutamic endopeptidase [Azorhizobium doebereinerae]|uniref:CPBP family intramembrane glutamic endopeptidase n=1 Tax=Azorhizobium doebereinerae TaxID=281091 RepID=UPI0004131C30|nr:CPBP family intramembrane glutamic endopeptidase [Azorhizobium doebereinerae]
MSADATPGAIAPRPPFIRRGPWHALGTQLLCLAGVFAILPFVIVAVLMAVHLAMGGIISPDPTDMWEVRLWSFVLLLAVLPVCLMLLSGFFGRIVGSGDVWQGIGDGPILRPLAVIALSAAAMAVADALDQGDVSLPLDILRQVRLAAEFGQWYWRGAELLLLLAIVVFGPMAEEMFCRGWIWVELRRSWSVPAVMLATAVPFLVLHGPLSSHAVLGTLPIAVALTLVRHVGGSVRAPILCHMAYNAGACATEFLP